MAFRFRKSIKIAPGVKVNLGKKGASVSVGKPGATVNVSSRGTRTTVGIPGTGISHSTISKHQGGDDGAPANQGNGCAAMGCAVFVVIIVIAIVVSAFSRIYRSAPPDKQIPKPSAAVGGR
jgi:hypothetical protein